MNCMILRKNQETLNSDESFKFKDFIDRQAAMKNGCLFQLFRTNHVILKKMQKENENGTTTGRDKKV